MNVYRVETKFSVLDAGATFGPYSFYPEKELLSFTGFTWGVYSAVEFDPVVHMEPWEDGIPDFDIVKHSCGFSSLDSLYKWFVKSINNLLHGGFYIAVYDVPDHNILIGNNQLAFDKSCAIQIDCKYF